MAYAKQTITKTTYRKTKTTNTSTRKRRRKK